MSTSSSPPAPSTLPRRRKHDHDDNAVNVPMKRTACASEGSDTPQRTTNERSKKKRRVARCVQISQLTNPKSLYEGWCPPLPPSLERDAIYQLCKIRVPSQQEEHIIVDLEDFSVYKPYDGGRHADEFTPLHCQNNDKGADRLLFDGILTANGYRRYVQRVTFDCLTVEGYGDLHQASVADSICIQSPYGKRCDFWYHSDIWYRLGSPAPEYRRYHDAFLWIADLGKHFVDYLLHHAQTNIGLNAFRCDFYAWLSRQYQGDPIFSRWVDQYKSVDFRQSIASNVGYLWKECFSIDETLCSHAIWSEIDPAKLGNKFGAIHQQINDEQNTIATPFVYECFSHMYFASRLTRRTVINPRAATARRRRKAQLHLTPTHCEFAATPSMSNDVGIIREGDVVCTHPDFDSKWKSSTQRWYAYVQAVHNHVSRQMLDVIWLYEPCDTVCGQGHYPFKNELFMSDNCSCGSEAIESLEVIGKVTVTWFCTNPDEAAADNCFFVRQKFRTEHSLGADDFVALSKDDFRCRCKVQISDMDEVLQNHSIGDTVLFWCRTTDGGALKETLDPGQIIDFHPQEESLAIRLLPRASLSFSERAPNELLLGTETCLIKARHVIRKCRIVQFPSADDVAYPYNAGGTGDHFFIILDSPSNVDNSRSAICQELQSIPTYEPKKHAIPRGSKLRCLSLFSGGGNFDRGLEDGGAVSLTHAVDWASLALHSLRANLPDPQSAHLFLGSVNDYLAKACKGSSQDNIASVGQIDIVSAGSPCQGFSFLQQQKQSERSLTNASLVAAVLTAVDIYVPQYLVFENVANIASESVKGQSVFSQIVCCLVGMGYQVQHFLMDAFHYGSFQSRSRVFIVASVPGIRPLVRPPYTHASPRGEGKFISRTLGRLSNGLPFGRRFDDVTPFPFAPIRSATSDLPDIGDAHVDACVPFPDHRTSRKENDMTRNMLTMIPRLPLGMNFVKAAQRGKMSARQMSWYNWKSSKRSQPQYRSWARVFPDHTLNCVTTACVPYDAFNGRFVHWEQHRILTVMEARRAQDFLDHEVILGTPAQQWKIIGNSVNRKVAFALGLSLKESWLASSPQQRLRDSGDHAPDLTSGTLFPGARIVKEVVIERRRTTTTTVISKETTSSAILHYESPEQQDTSRNTRAPREGKSSTMSKPQIDPCSPPALPSRLDVANGPPTPIKTESLYWDDTNPVSDEVQSSLHEYMTTMFPSCAIDSLLDDEGLREAQQRDQQEGPLQSSCVWADEEGLEQARQQDSHAAQAQSIAPTTVQARNSDAPLYPEAEMSRPSNGSTAERFPRPSGTPPIEVSDLPLQSGNDSDGPMFPEEKPTRRDDTSTASITSEKLRDEDIAASTILLVPRERESAQAPHSRPCSSGYVSQGTQTLPPLRDEVGEQHHLPPTSAAQPEQSTETTDQEQTPARSVARSPLFDTTPLPSDGPSTSADTDGIDDHDGKIDLEQARAIFRSFAHGSSD